MNKLHSVLLLAMMTTITACNRPAAPNANDSTAATSAASVTESPTTNPSTPDNAEASAAANAEADAVANAALEAATQGPAPVAGQDYIEIRGGNPYAPLDGKIEVVEVFGYVCPACARFQPLVRAWKNKLPSDIRFTYVPALFGGPWDRYGSAFYASEAMGLVERTHDALYAAIHVQQTLKGERGEDSVQDIAAFYGQHGANPGEFASTMESFGVKSKMTKAKQFAMRSGVDSTPTIIINGKYRVTARSYEEVLRVANQLIAKERAALPAATTSTSTSVPAPVPVPRPLYPDQSSAQAQ